MRSARIIPVVLTLVLAAVRLDATSYIMVSDDDLADQAPVIVQATVLATEPAPITGPPSTDTFIQVERVLKGYVAGSTVVVRLLGGIGLDGFGLRIWGAPSFRTGGRVLIFLQPREDGTYAVLHLMLGAFYEIEEGGGRWAVRNLTEAVDAYPGDRPWEVGGLDLGRRDFDRFVEWLVDRDRGFRRTPDYFVEGGGLSTSTLDRPLLLEDRCTQRNFRWFEFDRGRRVAWRIHSAGFDGEGSGRRAFAAARNAWRHAAESGIRLTLAGETRSRAGLTAMDGVNGLLFNDPGDLAAGRFTCSSGGVLAVTGIWFENGRNQECQVVAVGQKGRFRGEVFLKILSADIVTNDGSACYFASSPAGMAEVLAHELGHTLGLAHSGVKEALMRGPVHDDGRGAFLHTADLEAVDELYEPLKPLQPRR